eukprot:Nk52_evm41s2367 gene=Nk52_evmTU41s2367
MVNRNSLESNGAGSPSTIQFSADVEDAIALCLPSDDPLDNPKFNSVEYINSLFPNEHSLNNVDSTISKLKHKINGLDQEVRLVVRNQTYYGHDGQNALNGAQDAIQELFGRVKDIKKKAELSEIMVQEITRDIKALDYAKKNLTTSITTLNHLHMLVSGVETLTEMTKRGQYKKAANLLQGLLNILNEFESYKHLEKIESLSSQIHTVKDQLHEKAVSEFEHTFAKNNREPINAKLLIEACMVMNVLPKEARTKLIQWFVNLQVSDYKIAFNENLEASGLEKLERRYAWLKRCLTGFTEECGDIFPESWCIAKHITIGFCHQTRVDFSKLLEKRKDSIDVKLLLFALGKTIQFERYLELRFKNDCESSESDNEEAEVEVEEGEIAQGSSRSERLAATDGVVSADSVREKYLRFKREKEKMGGENGSLQEKKKRPSIFSNIISECFEPYLSVFIEAQDENLKGMFSDFSSTFKEIALDENINRDAGPARVHPSCADLFVFYKNCLVQCSQLSVKKPLLDLYRVFAKYLNLYCSSILISSLPKAASMTSSSLSAFYNKTESTEMKLSVDDLYLVCCIINTAEYCRETTKQLEEKIIEKIDASLKDRVDMNTEQDVFHEAISLAIQALVRGVDSALDASLTAMAKIPWSTIENVGDQSPYVSAINEYLTQTGPIIRLYLSSSKYYTSFCSKFVNLFIPQLVNNIYKCKPMNDISAEQLLLDIHSIKTILLGFPSFGVEGSGGVPSSYAKFVNKAMAKAEMILKVIMTPASPEVTFVQTYINLVADADISSFQKILDMKGVRKGEQQQLLDVFKRHLPAPPSANFVQSATVTEEYDASRMVSQNIKKLESIIKRF